MEICLFLVFKYFVLLHPSISLHSSVVKSEMLYLEKEMLETSIAAECDAVQNLRELCYWKFCLLSAPE